MKKTITGLPGNCSTHAIKGSNIQSVTLCILILMALWTSSVSAFETWSENSVNNTGYCAECHGDFGQFPPDLSAPTYVSKAKNGQTWDFTGLSAGQPVSLMDLHSATETLSPASEVTPPLSCDSCHDVDVFTAPPTPVTLDSSLNGTTCISSGCHDGKTLRNTHRNSTNFQTEAAALPADTQTCGESNCHSSDSSTTSGGDSGGGGGGSISPLFMLFLLLYALNPIRISRKH